MSRIGFHALQLESLPNTRLVNFPDKVFASVSTDTRTLRKGAIYVAIKGERYDGHDFVKEAIKKGAGAVAIEEHSNISPLRKSNIPVIITRDTVALYGQLARIRRKQLSAKVVSITGSNGKTSTKEMIAALLSEKFAVHATKANNNNHIGVPLTILQAPLDTEVLVLEHGTNHFGEIAYSAMVAQPDHAMITNIGASHLEYFKTQTNVFNEKKALFEEMDTRSGNVYLNIDDKFLRRMVHQYPNVTTFGTRSSADVVCKIKGFTKAGYPKVHLEGFGKSFTFTSPLYGKQNAWNLNAAIAVCLKLGLSKQEIYQGIKKINAAKHRLVPLNIHNGIVIDDTYNANPQSMSAGFDVLRNIRQYAKRWVVLGDMLELGKNSEKLHRELARQIMKIKNIRVLTYGEMMHALFMELKKFYVPVWHCPTRESLTDAIRESDFSDAVTLVKGSRGMKMEDFVTTIVEKYL